MLGKMDCSGRTDVGRARSTNEDHFLIAEMCKSTRVISTSLGLDHQTRLFGEAKGVLLMVADGMGGHEAGERASQIVVDSLIDYVLNDLLWPELTYSPENLIQASLLRGVEMARQALTSDAREVPQREGMGTTLTLLLVTWPIAYLLHVGDSRCYLMREGELKQVTTDHTVEQLKLDLESGKATTEQKQRFDGVNWQSIKSERALWNVLATNAEEVLADFHQFELKVGDTVLLCTDGLNRHVSDKEIGSMLSKKITATRISEELIGAANEAGGTDNTTTIVAKFISTAQLERAQQEVALQEVGGLNSDTKDFVISELDG